MSLSNPLYASRPTIDNDHAPLYNSSATLPLPSFFSWTTYLPLTQPSEYDPTPRYLIPERSWREALEMLYLDLKTDFGPSVSWFLYRYAIVLVVFGVVRTAICSQGMGESQLDMCQEGVGDVGYWVTTLFPFRWYRLMLILGSWLMGKVR
jgi:hypothetical protein